MFLLYIMILIFLLKDGYLEGCDIAIYENFTPCFAALAFVIVTERMLGISVNGGVSRRTFIIGTGITAPVFAVITAILTEAAYLLTYPLFSLNGVRLDCFPTAIGFGLSTNVRQQLNLHPKMILFNTIIIFFVSMVTFAIALIFIECRHRLNSTAAVCFSIPAAIYAFLCSRDEAHINILIYDIIDLDRILYSLDMIILPDSFEPYSYDALLPTYPEAICVFIFWSFVLFMISYLIFILLMYRVPVRGNSNGGEVI